MIEPTLSQCRAAVRAARSAEFGKSAVDSVRSRGVLGVVRDRGPVSIMLYVAAREGRLVWHGANGFALIESPLPARGPLFTGGCRLTALRLVDRHWGSLVFGLPPAIALLLAGPLLLVPPLWTGAAILALYAFGHVAFLMLVQAVWAGRWLYRLGGRGNPIDQAAAESLPALHWHLPLCHQADPGRADELLRQASARLIRLVTARVRATAGEIGGRARDVDVTETLVCLIRGVTTAPMRARIETAAGVIHPYGRRAEVAIMTLPDTAQNTAKRPFDRGGFLFWYLAGLAAAVFMNAFVVTSYERSACQGSDCALRPTSYGAAVRWLAGRLVLSDLSEQPPVTTGSWILGWLVSVAGLMTIPVAIVAGRRFRGDQRHVNAVFEAGVQQAMSQPKVLILVVKQVERNAVLEAVQAVNGQPARMEFRGPHTVFALGSVGGANVLLAQSGEQGMAGPTGMMLTAAGVIEACQPDYVILTGICFGLWEEEQQLGDILVPQRVLHLDHQTKDGETTWYRGQNVSPSPTLLDRFNAATYGYPSPKIHFGLMVATNTVFNSPSERQKLKQEQPYAMGGDMEGAAVYAAAAKQKVDWIVVKAISDWGMNWPSSVQEEAARNAAAFVVHTIRLGSLQEPPTPDQRRERSA